MTLIEYGCECTDCLVHPERPAKTAPLMYEIERRGKRMKVCSRCQLSSDTILKNFVTRDTPIIEFARYDGLGLTSLALLTAAAQQKAERN